MSKKSVKEQPIDDLNNSLPAGKIPQLPKFTTCTADEIAGLFNVIPRSVYVWIESGGCPCTSKKTKTGKRHRTTFNLYDVIKWRMQNGEDASVKAKIEQQRLRRITSENDERDGLTMLRADHDAIEGSRFLSIRNFVERTMPKTRAQRAMRTQEELIALDYEFTHGLMEAMGGAPVKPKDKK